MTIEFTVANIKKHMKSAVDEYTNWQKREQTENKRAKIASGFFSWLRHGSRGIADAQAFLTKIERAQTEQAAATVINSFLSNQMTKTCIHDPDNLPRHAFVSFVLDELAQFKGLEKISDYIKNTSLYNNLVHMEAFEGFHKALEEEAKLTSSVSPK